MYQKLENVPYLQTLYSNISDMDNEQKEFYFFWRDNFKRGNILDIQANISYIFVYMYEVVKSDDYEYIENELLRIQKSYGMFRKINEYCNKWIADCYIARNDFESALKFLPDNFALKIKCNYIYTNEHFVNDFPFSSMTKFGVTRIEEIKAEVIKIYEKYEAENNINIIEECMGFNTTESYLFSGSGSMRPINNYTSYYFDKNKYYNYFPNILKDAENNIRDKYDLPRIGEGWISETILYYYIKKLFSDYEVLQHGRPGFLGQQHLDVYIPELQIAFEYQGIQHSKPVDFFGGEEAFVKTKERDERKSLLCKKNNVKLFFVLPDYEFEELILEIKKFFNKKKVMVKMNSLYDISHTDLPSNTEKLKNFTGKSTSDSEISKDLYRWLYQRNPHRTIMSEEEIEYNLNYYNSQLSQSTYLFEKKYWLSCISKIYYDYRDKQGYLEKCLDYLWRSVEIYNDCKEEWEKTDYQNYCVPVIKFIDGVKTVGDPFVYSYTNVFEDLAIIYEKLGEYSKAFEVCNTALNFGLNSERTNGGFIGRRERLNKRNKKKLNKS